MGALRLQVLQVGVTSLQAWQNKGRAHMLLQQKMDAAIAAAETAAESTPTDEPLPPPLKSPVPAANDAVFEGLDPETLLAGQPTTLHFIPCQRRADCRAAFCETLGKVAAAAPGCACNATTALQASPRLVLGSRPEHAPRR